MIEKETIIVVSVAFDSEGMTGEEVERLRVEAERRVSAEVLKFLDGAVLGAAPKR